MFARMVAKLARRGFTRFEIAGFLEVNRETVRRWEAAYPEFCGALKSGAGAADDRVERSLYERAVGYSFESEKLFCGKDGAVTRVPYVVHCPPDVTAQIFWLKNRRPNTWRDRADVSNASHVTWIFDDPTQRPEGYNRKSTGRANGASSP